MKAIRALNNLSRVDQLTLCIGMLWYVKEDARADEKWRQTEDENESLGRIEIPHTCTSQPNREAPSSNPICASRGSQVCCPAQTCHIKPRGSHSRREAQSG
jgi:hypothetical protein